VHLPVDRVKLDAKLTVAATSTGRQQTVLEALIRLGRSLGVQVLAQGIETRSQLEALGRMGCELGQGSLLSLPLEPAEALQLAELSNRRVAPGA
jgi:EAL domain-containing protein (putative c-di-GMP-specific phosphodiesterase class I)